MAVDVVAMGLVTPVGMGVEQTAASVLAGLDAFEERSVVGAANGAQVMALLPEDALPPLVDGMPASLVPSERRLLRLVTPALAEAMAEAADPTRTPVLLATPEGLELGGPFLDRVAAQTGLDFPRGKSRCVGTGASGVFEALDLAMRALDAGEADEIVVGGVDTFLDLMRLAALEADRRLLGPSTMDGFIPGEGAATLLLRRYEGRGQAQIRAVALGREPGHRGSDEPNRGEGLSTAVKTLLSAPGVPDTPIETAYLGFNGESFPAKEWGVTLMRSGARFADEFDVRHPADCVGDLGAASAATALALAAAGLADQTCSGPCLVWAGSDGPGRGAALVDRND